MMLARAKDDTFKFEGCFVPTELKLEIYDLILTRDIFQGIIMFTPF
jgi:hypothetical protein